MTIILAYKVKTIILDQTSKTQFVAEKRTIVEGSRNAHAAPPPKTQKGPPTEPPGGPNFRPSFLSSKVSHTLENLSFAFRLCNTRNIPVERES